MIISAKLRYNSKVDRYCYACDKLIRIPFIDLAGYPDGLGNSVRHIYKCALCDMYVCEYNKLSDEDFNNLQSIRRALNASDIAKPT